MRKSDFHIDTGKYFPRVGIRFVVRVMDERQFPPEKVLYACQTTYPYAMSTPAKRDVRLSWLVLQYDPFAMFARRAHLGGRRHLVFVLNLALQFHSDFKYTQSETLS